MKCAGFRIFDGGGDIENICDEPEIFEHDLSYYYNYLLGFNRNHYENRKEKRLRR